MKKREIIWYVIPCISILFVGFVFLLSFSVNVRGLILRSVTVCDLDSESEKSYIMGYNPKARDWSVTTNNTTNAKIEKNNLKFLSPLENPIFSHCTS